MATTKEARNKNIPGFNTIPLEVKVRFPFLDCLALMEL
jgi:hypothetical protein